MWRRIRLGLRGERGSAILVAVFASFMILAVAGAAVDLGFYYMKYQRARYVANMSTELVQKMMAVYLASTNEEAKVEMQVVEYAIANGLDPQGIYADIQRGRESNGVTDTVKFYWTFQYKDPYECMFLSLIGINELPVDIRIVDNLTVVGAHIWDNGDPYKEWRPDRVPPSS